MAKQKQNIQNSNCEKTMAKQKRLHIVMYPWLAMGHIIPFLHLANKLAHKGHRVTFFLPTKPSSSLSDSNLHPTLITLHPITVPHVHPLPPGTQTASDIPIHLSDHLATAMDMTRPELERLILNLNPKPDLLVYDVAFWIPDIAAKIGVKTVCYKVVCAASLAIAVVPARKLTRERPVSESDLAVLPEGYPSKDVVLRGAEWRNLLFIGLEFGSGLTFYDRITTAIASCDAIALRTCREVEGRFCDYLASQYNKPVFLTGPVLPELNASTELDGQWANFLSRFDPGSVIFCAFGSQFVLEEDQFKELLLGFELSGKPFLVAVKPPPGCASVTEALPDGFLSRVGDRGEVHGEWVPQTQILSHPSVGCFVNHCGFGSMWESLVSESQIVLVPQLGDQILNARIIAGEMKVAVEVKREESGWVSKESLCKAISDVMDVGSPVGELVRKNHEKWRNVFGAKGFMDGYIDGFVEDLVSLAGSPSC